MITFCSDRDGNFNKEPIIDDIEGWKGELLMINEYEELLQNCRGLLTKSYYLKKICNLFSIHP
jgi:adenylosuccinate synthase